MVAPILTNKGAVKSFNGLSLSHISASVKNIDSTLNTRANKNIIQGYIIMF